MPSIRFARPTAASRYPRYRVPVAAILSLLALLSSLAGASAQGPGGTLPLISFNYSGQLIKNGTPVTNTI